MPPNPYARVSEIRNLKNPRIPEMFFSATEEQLVEALAEMGYGRRTAEKEARQFIEYRDSLSSAQGTWTDDEEAPAEPAPEYQGFGASVARMKEMKGE